jgi:CheY-like chemotaxis protein
MTSGRILLVDDDRDLREVLCEALELEGYAVTCREHGEAALQYLRAQPPTGGAPCLILLDLMMPVMDGKTFREELLKDPQLGGIPVVLLTAGGQQLASTVKADKVLHKPLRMDALLNVVKEYCTPAAPS